MFSNYLIWLLSHLLTIDGKRPVPFFINALKNNFKWKGNIYSDVPIKKHNLFRACELMMARIVRFVTQFNRLPKNFKDRIKYKTGTVTTVLIKAVKWVSTAWSFHRHRQKQGHCCRGRIGRRGLNLCVHAAREVIGWPKCRSLDDCRTKPKRRGCCQAMQRRSNRRLFQRNKICFCRIQGRNTLETNFEQFQQHNRLNRHHRSKMKRQRQTKVLSFYLQADASLVDWTHILN